MEIPTMAHISAAIMALMHLINLPRITEDEWESRYVWLSNDDGDCELLEDTPNIRALLAQHDHHYVWTLIDGDDGHLIVPGFRSGIGWYLCERPWRDDAMVAVALPDADPD
jgi:hypothetical protein